MKKLIIISFFVFTIIFSSTISAQSPLPAGTYTIGNGGDFTTITSVFSKLSTDGIAGPVTLELTDTLYSAAGFAINGPITGAGPDSRVTIRPADNKNVTIQGNSYGFGFQFSNISYLTLDGIALTGPTTLTVHSLSTTSYAGALNFTLNSDHNIVQNITVINEAYKNFTQETYWEFSDGIAFWKPSNYSGTVSPDSNLIQNNFIKKASVGIYLAERGFGSSAICTGNIVRNNIIGSETDSLISWGIECEVTKNTIVEGNVIQNIRGNIEGTIPNWSPQHIQGINLWGTTDCIIRNNIVHNVKAGDYPCTGILLSSPIDLTPVNNLVYNNMIYDIQSTSSNLSSHTSGIEMLYQNNPKIYYNSIYLSGTGNGANHRGSAALWVDNNCKNVIVKNNIFVNTRDESPNTASSIYDYTASNLTSDNNDLFNVQNQYNCLAVMGFSKYNTLTDWQAEGKDMESISGMLHFKVADLHIDESIPTNLESHGVPIAGIDVDFDGEARDTVSPDIGADEFDGTTIVGVKNNSTPPLRFALEQNYPNPFNPTTYIQFTVPKTTELKINVYSILGEKVLTVAEGKYGSGSYKVKINASGLPSGIYIYRIESGVFTSTKKMVYLK